MRELITEGFIYYKKYIERGDNPIYRRVESAINNED